MKPAAIRKLLSQQYPDALRVEMFARDPADADWEVWGNEAPALAAD